MQGTDKAPDAFRTISEVAEDLDLPQHVLRFWETRFPQIKPLKRGGGRRYYRPDDVHLLRGIRRLLYGEGYTIKGVQKILRDQGLRYVASLGREAPAAEVGHREAPPLHAMTGEPPPPEGPHLYAPPGERARSSQSRSDMPERDAADLFSRDPSREEPDPDEFTEEWGEDEDDNPVFEGPEIRVDPASRPVPRTPPSRAEPPAQPPRYAPSVQGHRVEIAPEPPPAAPPPERPPLPRQLFVPQAASHVAPEPPAKATPVAPAPAVSPPMPEPMEAPHAPAPSFPLAYGPQPLPDDSKRKLRTALAELAECRRILEKAR